MMTEGMPPALPLFIAAALFPFLPLALRRALTIVAPLAGIVAMYSLPAGNSWTMEFLGLPLVWARADRLSLIFGLVFLVIGLLANLYGWQRPRRGEQAAGLAYPGGVAAGGFAGALLTMFAAWEIMAVASVFLIFARRSRAALAAGQRYLMVHISAGGALLLGVLLVLRASGSTAFGELGGFGPASWLILLAFCVNAAVPPVHAWLPDAYPEGSVAGSVFLSAFTTKAAVYCLIRAFPGTEILVWAGAAMAVYGVVFAVLENNIRRLLAYHIVSQVGYMVCGVGVGTEMALNGSAAHAFCHILYKGLLFMGAGAVLHVTGRQKLTELGGLARSMPVTWTLYMVGALSISGVPLFNGFISKSLVVAAAAADQCGIIVLLLELASVGTFLSVALKLPYFACFGTAANPPATEAPRPMLAAMSCTAALCIALGVAPQWLYVRLPYAPVHYVPYTAAHVLEMLSLLVFTALGFWWWRHQLRPHDAVTLDTDWFYRQPAARFVPLFAAPLDLAAARLGSYIRRLADQVTEASHNPTLVLVNILRGNGRASWQGENPDEPLPVFDEDRQRQPVALTLLLILTVFAALGVVFRLTSR